jgi:hypothetical protein
VRRVTPAADTRVACSVAPIVIASEPAGAPHEEQNRAPSGIAAPQLKQGTEGLYADPQQGRLVFPYSALL